MLVRLVERMIAAFKNEPGYRLMGSYTDRQIFFVLLYRGAQVLRGLLVRIKLKETKGILFCGRRVVIEHGYLITTGPSLILEDNIHINALSDRGIHLGNRVTVGKGAIIVCTGVVGHRGVGLTVGDNVGIGSQSFIGAQGGIFIGNDVIMGPGVRMFAENHNFESNEKPIRLQGETRKGIYVEDNCWIGAGATILDGVRLGGGSIIAAGSVVTHDVAANSIVGGVPARVLGSRFDKKRKTN